MTEPDLPPSDSTRQPIRSALMHDLRTPLNHIIGYSELMIDQAEEEGNAGLLKHLEKIRAAGFHLMALLDENFVPLRETDGDEAPPHDP